ncbi:MAG: hypothetical protein JHC30_05970 [Caldisericum sp.]|nr:hypothetical protein [Caldisericum sp.]
MKEVSESEERLSFYKRRCGDVIILNGVGEVSQGADLLKEYFWIFTVHDSHRVILRLFRRSLACFYTFSIPHLWELQEREFEVREVNFHVQIEDGIFFYERDQRLDLSLFKPQRVVYVLVGGKKAGVYFEKDQVLIATYWTHNVGGIRMLSQLMPYLSRIFKKRPETPPKPCFRIMFGADPEFELIRLINGKVVSANGIVQGGTGPNELVGRDGAGNQVEIRPAPSWDLRKFVSNFRNGLREFARMYPGYSLGVKGDVYPLGGHIHISVPPYDDILLLLDNWIGQQVIDLSGRARGSYKRLGAYETKPWGFEYRTPPSAIFLKSSVLYSVLKVIKRVISAYFTLDGVSVLPTDEEIDRLCIRKEWGTLNDFIARYSELDKDVLKQWRIKRIKPESRVDLVFRDDWDSEVKEFVSSVLASKLSKFAKKLNKKGIYRVILFGFGQSRGMVCNFESSIFERLDFVYNVNEDERAFGLPYSVRVAVLTDDLKTMWIRIADEIVSNLLE